MSDRLKEIYTSNDKLFESQKFEVGDTVWMYDGRNYCVKEIKWNSNIESDRNKYETVWGCKFYNTQKLANAYSDFFDEMVNMINNNIESALEENMDKLSDFKDLDFGKNTRTFIVGDNK